MPSSRIDVSVRIGIAGLPSHSAVPPNLPRLPRHASNNDGASSTMWRIINNLSCIKKRNRLFGWFTYDDDVTGNNVR